MILILRRLARKRTLWIRAIYIFLLLILILIYIVCVLYFVTRPQPPSPRLDLNGTYADRQRTSPNDSRIDSTTLQVRVIHALDSPSKCWQDLLIIRRTPLIYLYVSAFAGFIRWCKKVTLLALLQHYELGIRGFDPEIGVLSALFRKLTPFLTFTNEQHAPLDCQWGLVYEDRKNSLGEDTFLKPNSSANGLSTPSYLYQDVWAQLSPLLYTVIFKLVPISGMPIMTALNPCKIIPQTLTWFRIYIMHWIIDRQCDWELLEVFLTLCNRFQVRLSS